MEYSERIFEQLYKISRAINRREEISIPRYPLTILQIQLLVMLKQKKSLQIKEIAEIFRVRMPTANSLLRRLTAIKLVSRKKDKKDGRIVRISLTVKGEKYLDEALKKRMEKFDKLTAYIPKKEQQVLLNILESLVIKLEKEDAN